MTGPTVARLPLARLHLSENPYGPSPAALAAARAALEATSVYPDPAREQVTAALADRYGVAPEQVAVANGSDELVLLSALSVGTLGRPGVTTAATFPGYRICLEQAGRGCEEVPLRGGDLDLSAFLERLPEAGVGYLCNPHNPTGGALSPSALAAVADLAQRCDVPVIVDEAYWEFAPEGTRSVLDLLDSGAPLMALRTFSKAYGLAALRVGYAMGRADLIARVRQAQATMPFSVNRVAQAAAIAALDDRTHLAEVRARNAERRSWFQAEATRRGRSCLPSVTNFVAVAVDDSSTAEKRLAQDHAILVRDAGRFGWPGHLRVSIGPEPDLVRFLDALDDISPVRA